jgi:hypothetical protein
MSRHRKNIDWESIDWSLTTQEIMRLTGRVQGTVCQARKRFAPSTVRKQKKHMRWDLVDWTKSVSVIRAETGASASSVSDAKRRWASGDIQGTSIAVRVGFTDIQRWSDAAHLAGFRLVSDWLIALANKHS